MAHWKGQYNFNWFFILLDRLRWWPQTLLLGFPSKYLGVGANFFTLFSNVHFHGWIQNLVYQYTVLIRNKIKYSTSDMFNACHARNHNVNLFFLSGRKEFFLMPLSVEASWTELPNKYFSNFFWFVILQ